MEKNLPARLKVLLVVGLVAGLVSCGVLEGITSPGVAKPAGTEAQQPVVLPTVVAVMPFAHGTQDKDTAERMRKSFYNFFSSTPYVDVELGDVDEGIVRLERNTGKKAAEMNPQEICQAIGCDGLLFGKVLDYQKVFGGVYSRLRAEVEVWMVNAQICGVSRRDGYDCSACPAVHGRPR